jgi:hypothetical protein
LWVFGLGGWAPIPNPQSPIPNPQSPIPIKIKTFDDINFNIYYLKKIFQKNEIYEQNSE